MRLSFYGIFTQILCLGMLYASDGEAQKSKSLKEVFVQLEQKEATLVEVFKQIESQTNFQFNYDKKSINKKTKVVFDSNQTSIEQLRKVGMPQSNQLRQSLLTKWLYNWPRLRKGIRAPGF